MEARRSLQEELQMRRLTVSTCVSVCVSHAGVSVRNMQVTCGVLKSR